MKVLAFSLATMFLVVIDTAGPVEAETAGPVEAETAEVLTESKLFSFC